MPGARPNATRAIYVAEKLRDLFDTLFDMGNTEEITPYLRLYDAWNMAIAKGKDPRRG